mgnify:CR=1 FL=1
MFLYTFLSLHLINSQSIVDKFSVLLYQINLGSFQIRPTSPMSFTTILMWSNTLDFFGIFGLLNAQNFIVLAFDFESEQFTKTAVSIAVFAFIKKGLWHSYRRPFHHNSKRWLFSNSFNSFHIGNYFTTINCYVINTHFFNYVMFGVGVKCLRFAIEMYNFMVKGTV